MKIQQIKVVIQFGRSKVECSGEFASVGWAKESKQKLLESLLTRAKKMIEVDQ